jgi:hypothetical protein
MSRWPIKEVSVGWFNFPYSLVLFLAMTLYISFFDYRNVSVTDKINCLTCTFRKEGFATSSIFTNFTFVTYFQFLLQHATWRTVLSSFTLSYKRCHWTKSVCCDSGLWNIPDISGVNVIYISVWHNLLYLYLSVIYNCYIVSTPIGPSSGHIYTYWK